MTASPRKLGSMSVGKKSTAEQLADAIEALKAATVRRRMAREGTPEHAEALSDEERLNNLVMDLAHRRRFDER